MWGSQGTVRVGDSNLRRERFLFLLASPPSSCMWSEPFRAWRLACLSDFWSIWQTCCSDTGITDKPSSIVGSRPGYLHVPWQKAQEDVTVPAADDTLYLLSQYWDLKNGWWSNPAKHTTHRKSLLYVKLHTYSPILKPSPQLRQPYLSGLIGANQEAWVGNRKIFSLIFPSSLAFITHGGGVYWFFLIATEASLMAMGQLRPLVAP